MPSQINLRARLVLSDCQWALRQFSETVSGEPLGISWVAVVTLLRAVGNVLQADAKADADVGYAVKEKRKSHTYKFDALSVTSGPLPPQEMPLKSLVAEGPFKGRSEKDVAEEAIRWWMDYLDEVESLALRRKANARA
jgi:hypothetical protein